MSRSRPTALELFKQSSSGGCSDVRRLSAWDITHTRTGQATKRCFAGRNVVIGGM